MTYNAHHFAVLLDAQPSNVRGVLELYIWLVKVEMGQAQLVETKGDLCIFEDEAGDRFSVAKPAITDEEETALLEELRVIVNEALGNDKPLSKYK